jgi:hypothetical protein
MESNFCPTGYNEVREKVDAKKLRPAGQRVASRPLLPRIEQKAMLWAFTAQKPQCKQCYRTIPWIDAASF